MKPVCIKTFIPRHLHSQFFRGWDIRVAFSQESSFNTLWRANQPLTPTFLSISPHYRSHHKYEWERDCCVFFFHIEATYSKMGVRDVLGEVVPFTVMVTMEGCTIGLTILAKTAMTNGMSPFVFVVYTNALASILLLPYSFIFQCRDRFCSLFFFFFFT